MDGSHTRRTRLWPKIPAWYVMWYVVPSATHSHVGDVKHVCACVCVCVFLRSICRYTPMGPGGESKRRKLCLRFGCSLTVLLAIIVLIRCVVAWLYLYLREPSTLGPQTCAIPREPVGAIGVPCAVLCCVYMYEHVCPCDVSASADV